MKRKRVIAGILLAGILAVTLTGCKNTGSSKHVAIEVADDTGSRISNGSVRNMAVDSQQQAKMVLKGRMISPQGKAISGSVSSLMELAFGYK